MSENNVPPQLSAAVSSETACGADKGHVEPAGEVVGGGEVLELTRALNEDGSIRDLSIVTPPPKALDAERPLEDRVRDIVTPMVRAWLDENLQPMVVRLVKEEMARGAGPASPGESPV